MGRIRPFLLPAGLALGLFVLTAVMGYVYSHEPARDALLVEFEGTPAPQPAYLIGSVSALEGDTLRLDVGGGGQREVTVLADTPVEVLERLQAALDAGAMVNVGVDDTSFGQVLTGIVAIQPAEGAP